MDGGWMDCVGKGGRHLRFNLVVPLRRMKGGAALKPNAALSSKFVVGFWWLPKVGRLSDRRREGTCLRAMQVTYVLQSSTHAHCRNSARQQTSVRYCADQYCSARVHGKWLGGEPGPLGTWAPGHWDRAR